MHKNTKVRADRTGVKKLGIKNRGFVNSTKVAHVHLKRTTRLGGNYIGISVLLVCHKVGNLVTPNVTVTL